MKYFGFECSYEKMPGVEDYLGVDDSVEERRARKAFLIDMLMTVARVYESGEKSLDMDVAMWAKKLECSVEEALEHFKRLERCGIVVTKKRKERLKVIVVNLLKYTDEYTKKRRRKSPDNVRTLSGEYPGQTKGNQTKLSTTTKASSTTPPSRGGGQSASPPRDPSRATSLHAPRRRATPPTNPPPDSPDAVECSRASTPTGDSTSSFPTTPPPDGAGGGEADCPPPRDGGVGTAIAPAVKAVVDRMTTTSELHAYATEHGQELSDDDLACIRERYDVLDHARPAARAVRDPAGPLNDDLGKVTEEIDGARRVDAWARTIQRHLRRADGAGDDVPVESRVMATVEAIHRLGITAVAQHASCVIRDKAAPDSRMQSAVGVFQFRCKKESTKTRGCVR